MPLRSTEPVETAFTDYPGSVARVLDALDAGSVLKSQERVLIKPNLVNASPPPVTTPPAFCAALIDYIRAHGDPEIVIAEGSGDACRETFEIFDILGYTDLAREKSVSLADLNAEPTKTLKNPEARVFPEMRLPEIAFTHFVISAPVLKAHSLADITGAIKNMMGCLPPSVYGGGAGGWKKSRFHARMQDSLHDLHLYLPSNLSVMDASRGLADYHLGGRRLSPDPKLILAGFDARLLDRQAAKILGLDWHSIGHLNG